MIQVNRLILYKGFQNQKLFDDMCFLINHYEDEAQCKEEKVSLLYDCVNQLIELTAAHGFEGNVWHSFLTYLLANHENAFSKACEIVGEIEGSINKAADHDFAIFKELFDFDMNHIEKALGTDCISMLEDFKNAKSDRKLFNRRIRDRIDELAIHLSETTNVEEFHKAVVSFYKDFGVGKFGLHKAFCVRNEDGEVKVVPITNVSHIHFSDLVGYEIQKKKLCDNTDAFVEGKKANNCLLFGDAGTGKSSSVKALLNEYYDKGLRMIEVYKYQFQDLPKVIAQLKNRNYKFIIYMDDLSFEEFEVEYKYLKAVIEGGLEKKPDNVLIYATSNRRHLVREKFSDRDERDDELHTNDTVQEKISLSARFGVSIFYGKPNKREFQNIVKVLAERYNIYMKEEELYLEANKWEIGRAHV